MTTTIPSTTIDATTLVGHAVYLEATRSAGAEKYTLQLLLTPETNIGTSIVPLTMYRRRISSSHPRATWKSFTNGLNTEKAYEKYKLLVSSARQESMINDLLSATLSTLSTLKTNYTLVGAPIVVEVSRADVEDIRHGKSPYKVLGRIWKSRKKLGYPADFV